MTGNDKGFSFVHVKKKQFQRKHPHETLTIKLYGHIYIYIAIYITLKGWFFSVTKFFYFILLICQKWHLLHCWCSFKPNRIHLLDNMSNFSSVIRSISGWFLYGNLRVLFRARCCVSYGREQTGNVTAEPVTLETPFEKQSARASAKEQARLRSSLWYATLSRGSNKPNSNLNST